MLDRMNDFVRGHTVVAATFFLALYWVFALFGVPAHETIELNRIMQASISVVVVFAYVPIAYAAIKRGHPDLTDQVAMGITLWAFSSLASGLWFLLWRMSDQPDWMLDGYFAGFLVWLQILAAVLMVTAPGAINGRVPARNWIYVGASVGAALAAFLIVEWYEPKLFWLVEVIRPYVP